MDPLASMRCWAIEIELGGRVFDIPALPAVEWWPVLISGDLTQILDFVESRPDDPANLDEMILSDGVSSEDLTEALTDAIEETAGRSLHASIVIATVAGTHWPAVNGALASNGFRWDEQSLGAALDAVYAEITGRLKEDSLSEFLTLLDNEALTRGKPTGRQRAKAQDEFERMAGPRPTAGAVASGERSGNARPRTRPRPVRRLQDGRSVSPRKPRAERAGSGPEASSGSQVDADAPASGTGLRPPL